MGKNWDLQTEYDELIAEQRALNDEHARLKKNPHDIDAHHAHVTRLRRHIERLHAYRSHLRLDRPE